MINQKYIAIIVSTIFYMRQNQEAFKQERRKRTEHVSAHSIKTMHTGRGGPSIGRFEIGLDNLENFTSSDEPSGISFSQFQGMSCMYERQTEKYTEKGPSRRVVPTSRRSIKSSNLIEPPLQSKPADIEDTPNICNANSEANLSFTFDYKNITESEIFDNFLAFATKKNLQLVSSSANKITVKMQVPIYRKLLKICFPQNLLDNDVYQFKKSSKIKGRIKIILISGEEKSFETFLKEYTMELWKQGFIQCSIVEDIHYFLMQEQNGFPNSGRNFNMKQIKAIQCKLWKQYSARGNTEEMTPIVERIFLNEFYHNLQISKKIGEALLGEKEIGDIQRKKMIIKGSMNMKQILGYLELTDDLSQIVKKVESKGMKNNLFPKSMEILNNLTIDRSPCPYQWDTILATFEHTLKEQTKQYNKNQVKQLTFDKKLLKKLFVLLLIQSQNRDIWGIIETLMVFYDPEPCPEHIKRLQDSLQFLLNDWQI